MNQIIPPVIYQPVYGGGASGLRKQKLTKFSRDSLEWSGLFDVVFHQKQISDTQNMLSPKTGLMGKAKAAISGLRFNSQLYYQASDKFCEKFSRSDLLLYFLFKQKYTRAAICHNDSTSIVNFANVVTIMVETLTGIHIQPWIRRQAKLNNEKIFSTIERTVVAVYARLIDNYWEWTCFQRVALLQSVNPWELVSTDKLIV